MVPRRKRINFVMEDGMFAISFDMDTATLKTEYGDAYNMAYDEIALELEKFDFLWAQGSLYISAKKQDAMVNAWNAIDRLAAIPWFNKAVRDIRVFEINNWSDVTARVKSTGII